MPYHNFDHPFNTRIKKDPAVERWVHQRYLGQFGKFKINAYAVKWFAILYGIVPVTLFYYNEKVTAWLDGHREHDFNTGRFGRASWDDYKYASASSSSASKSDSH